MSVALAEHHPQQVHAVGADPFVDPRALRPVLGEAGLLGAGGIVPEPVRPGTLTQPVRLGAGHRVQGCPQTLRNQLQLVQLTHRGQHVRGVCPRSAGGGDQSPVPGRSQNAVQDLPAPVRTDQPVPEL